MRLEYRQRRRLRIFLSVMSIHSEAARRALRDRDLFDEVYDRLKHERTEDDRPILDLLDWLIENGDAILALIEKIIDLFAGMQAQALKLGCCGGKDHCKGGECCDPENCDRDDCCQK